MLQNFFVECKMIHCNNPQTVFSRNFKSVKKYFGPVLPRLQRTQQADMTVKVAWI
jgi:hypothetical protein